MLGIPSTSKSQRAEDDNPGGWRNPATVTVTPSSPDPVVVTDLALGPDDDTIWIHVTSTGSSDCPWPWSYAVLTWVNSQGREMGSTTIHGVCEGEVYRLGNGRKPVDRAGSVRIYPRSYNLAWVKLGHPWTLEFKFQTGNLAPTIEVPLDGGTLGGFTPDDGGAPIDLSIEDAFAYLILNFLLK